MQATKNELAADAARRAITYSNKELFARPRDGESVAKLVKKRRNAYNATKTQVDW